MRGYRMGQVAALLGLSPDTLRYYERLGLLPRVARSASGRRIYSEGDLARLRFIRRAQQMNFSLAEIGELLKMREDPQGARNEVRELTAGKLAQVEARLADLDALRKELRQLLALCRDSESGCPILENIGKPPVPGRCRGRGST